MFIVSAQIIFYHLYITDTGRNATLSATHLSSVRNSERWRRTTCVDFHVRVLLQCLFWYFP